MLRIHVILHRAVLKAVEHDVFNLAQSAAYSAMVALFPAMIVSAAVIAVLPDNAPIRNQVSYFFSRILPPQVMPLLEAYFQPHSSKSAQALLLAFLVSLTGASSVIATYMEGLRRASELPGDCWTFVARRMRSYALVPLSLLPLGIASMLVVFGHFVTRWLAYHVVPSMRTEVYVVASIIRWGVALASSIGLIGLIYHMGTPSRQPWRQVLPGAVAATAMWFLTTLTFGWYVTRFANYSQVYGSLGAGIALLFWLYIISLSVFFGAEFNAQFHLHGHMPVNDQNAEPS
ncbi:MAG: YihY/virulence factor BrkB family protein [Edaphobacter sp.]|uniref:YihY/virulence factor BrkB family protein n=1 Tax=Edaphobacter sp. TaxID=1934404 RepID=UPI0023A51B7D|nr:YihY/virulence factor BrkB family protein [Edaphobacter sp.]MDE1177205.1 YihY/virulence factor BrkB family protein [Edaphobacter sp.]